LFPMWCTHVCSSNAALCMLLRMKRISFRRIGTNPYVVYACFAVSHLTSLLTSVCDHGNTPGVHYHFCSDVYVPENKSNVNALLIHSQYAYTTTAHRMLKLMYPGARIIRASPSALLEHVFSKIIFFPFKIRMQEIN
jgi:hypothetical protein